jgi:four helix bundle protein
MYQKKSILMDKSKGFALRIIKLYKYLCEQKNEYVLSKQILRSGTSIGANIHEAFYAQSKADFISKLSISQKEGGETLYWLELLHDSAFIYDDAFKSIYSDCEELMKLLTVSIKKSKNLIHNT